MSIGFDRHQNPDTVYPPRKGSCLRDPFMLITRLIFSALMVAVGVSSPAIAASLSTVEPLNPTELNAVVAEIEAMVKTDESEVSAFVVREATPARIDRLYQMPELLTLDKNVRENGLIFAGHGSLLTFTKPSDILHKTRAWKGLFPLI